MTYALCTLLFFFFNDTATTEIYTLSLHDALPISARRRARGGRRGRGRGREPLSRLHGGDRRRPHRGRSPAGRARPAGGGGGGAGEHTAELPSPRHLLCRLLP